jgi:hypothetical protein
MAAPITKAQVKAIKAKAQEMAEAQAWNWHWDASHGEVMDPAWAHAYAEDIKGIEVWQVKDGTVKAHMPGGHYTAYEILEGAANAVLTDEQWNAAVMDFKGGTKGTAWYWLEDK